MCLENLFVIEEKAIINSFCSFRLRTGSLSDRINVHLLMAGTCSVATIKIPELVDKIRQEPGYQLKLVVTEHSRHFLPSLGKYRYFLDLSW